MIRILYVGWRRKSQFSQIMSFIILAVFVTFFIIFIRLSTIPSSLGTLNVIKDVHETESIRAGANVLFFSTEKLTGKSIMELVGLAAYIANDTIDFGPVIGQINVREEIEKRMDAMFGEGKWYVKIPMPERPANIQIVIVSDTSASLCDDLDDMKRLPDVLKKLKEKKINAETTLYLLPGGNTACDKNNAPDFIDASDFKTTSHFKPLSINIIQPKCGIVIDNDEAWAKGLQCAIKHGPIGGWKNRTIKIAIPLSDELPGGSESCIGKGSDKWNQLQKAIQLANERDVKIFSLMAESCGTIRFWYNHPPWELYNQFTTLQCNCKSNLEMYMQYVAEKTNGKMVALKNASEVTKSIEKIIIEQKPETLAYIDAGTWPPPQGKRVWSWDFEIPVSISGIYTTAYVYKWS